MENDALDFEKNCIRRAIVAPRWLPGSNSIFWYRRESASDKFQFILVDCERGHCRPAFDHTELASQLGSRTEENIEPDNLPFLWINVDTDASWMRFAYQDKLWQYSQEGKLEEWHGDFHKGHVDTGCEETASPWSRESASVRFINNTASRIEVHWISNEGKAGSPVSVHPGQPKTMTSWLGHIWRVAVPDTDKRVACELKCRRSTVTVEDSPFGLTLSWQMDPLTESLGAAEDQKSSETDLNPFLLRFNVWVRNSEGAEKQISYNGTEDNEFKEVYKSPNGCHAVAIRCKPASKSRLHLIQSCPTDQFRPKLISQDYLRAGDNVELKRLCLFDLVNRSEIFVDDALFNNPYTITSIGWSDDSKKYRFIYNERGHQHLRFLEIDVLGAVRVLAEEKSETFIDHHQKTYYKLLPSTNEFLWSSERNNWNHLYLFNLDDGTLKNQITKGPWVVRSIEHVDLERRQIWFEGLGMVPEQDPYYSHLACIAFDGSGLRVITQGDGTHVWKWGPDKRFLIDSWSRVDCLPQTAVRAADTGKEVVFLQKEQLDQDLEGKWAPPERFAATGRDGVTTVYGIILRPRGFDESKQYPVIEYIYAGPQSFITPKALKDLSLFRKVADQDLGYIWVCVDGMGTNWRSKSFHDVCYKNLKDGGFEDRIAWMRAAAESRPWMDLSRVGCYGTSTGGQNAAAAVIHHSYFYKAAVAAAGSHDNRMGHLLWNEMWMGYPVDASYEESSNATYAHRLGGALMLVVGGMDDNVDPSTTLRLAEALIKADKDFDMAFVPSGTHYVSEMPWIARKQAAFFKRHLRGCGCE